MSETSPPSNDAEKAKPVVSFGVVKLSKPKAVVGFMRHPKVLLILAILLVAGISLVLWSSRSKPKPITPKTISPNEGLVTDPVQIQKSQTEPAGYLAR